MYAQGTFNSRLVAGAVAAFRTAACSNGRMTATPAIEKGLNAFDNPFKDWPNDDLLVDASTRNFIRTNRSALLRVLDFPLLRDSFLVHDRRAAEARRASRATGLASVLMMGLGVMLAAATPLLDNVLAQKTASAISATFIVLGGCAALWHLLVSRQKMNWISNRFWAERIRQFHFQFLLNNIGEAAVAMRDDAALAVLTTKRERALLEFLQGTKYTSERIRELEQDLGEARVWLDPAWNAEPRKPDSSPELDELLEALYRLRIQIQDSYARLKGLPGARSPGTLAAAFKWIGDLCSAMVVAVAMCAVIATLAGAAQSVLVPLWVAIGVLSAAGLMTRALDHGLQSSLDQARNEWYLAAVEHAGVRFRDSKTAGRMQALRETERLAYQELRRFTIAHMRANFLM